METVPDFEDLLTLLAEKSVRYLIIGGIAFIYHGKPRYTKDMDLWLDPDPKNVERANVALTSFGSPVLLDLGSPGEILQLGIAPNRIDLLRLPGARFETAWGKRIRGRYGAARVNWIDIDGLIRIKSRIDDPRHRDDVRVLREVKKMRRAKGLSARKSKR
jgi:hypothetical protein